MAFGPTLYSKSPYGVNEYSENPPLISMGDSLASSDSGAVAVAVALADSVSAPTDAKTLAGLLALADAVAPFDTTTISAVVALTDFLLCKEFISGNLKRATTWTMGSASRTVTPHLYGSVLYAKNMYSTNIAILWAQAKKDTTPTFTNQNGHKYNS